MKSHPEIVHGDREKILRGKAGSVGKPDERIRELIRTMRRVMHEAEGVGLAAPQIGVPLRVFIAEVNKKFYALLNPEIVKSSSEMEYFEEGCLSVPGLYGNVKRPSKITVVAMNERGKRVKIKAWGLLARVFQHEIDHLNGVLFIDKAERTRRIEDGE